MLYRGKYIFVNGESFSVSRADKIALQSLADTRQLSGEVTGQVSLDVLESLYVWYQDGWLNLCT